MKMKIAVSACLMGENCVRGDRHVFTVAFLGSEDLDVHGRFLCFCFFDVPLILQIKRVSLLL